MAEDIKSVINELGQTFEQFKKANDERIDKIEKGEGVDALPPLAELPPLRRQAVCPSCNANFVVTDLMRSEVTCPICSERFNL